MAFCELTGRLDAAAAIPLRQELEHLLTDGRTRLVASMRDLEIISVAGIGALLDYHKQVLERKGGIRLVGVGPRVRRLLDLAQVSGFWGTYETEEEAVRSFTTPRGT